MRTLKQTDRTRIENQAVYLRAWTLNLVLTASSTGDTDMRSPREDVNREKREDHARFLKNLAFRDRVKEKGPENEAQKDQRTRGKPGETETKKREKDPSDNGLETHASPQMSEMRCLSALGT